MKRLLKYMLVGFLAGAAIGNLIALFTVDLYSPELLNRVGGSPAAAIVIQTVLSGLIGAAGFGGVLLYETDLPLAAATITHFLLIEVVFLPSALFLGWLEFKLLPIAVMMLIRLAAFFIVWLIMYFRYKRLAKELNDEIDKKS